MAPIKIIVVGLGLIGGSFCKAITRKTPHICMGIDTDAQTLQEALKEGAIQKAAEAGDLAQADLTIVCLHPEKTIAYLQEHRSYFKKGSIVIDVCGVKQPIMDAAADMLLQEGVSFVGTHPMAGREFSGYAYAQATLFEGASFIIIPPEGLPDAATDTVKTLAGDLGFTKIVFTTAKEHDCIIAFTSQLAHVVSNAYVKSPTLRAEMGFSAGSFLDLTRVAKLNEEMWSALFCMNQEPLLFELSNLIKNLQAYQAMLESGNREGLRELLKEGRVLKEESLGDSKPVG